MKKTGIKHKKYFFEISLFTMLIGLSLNLNSCSLETSNNGDLDGFWHLEKIDTLSNGSIKDLSENKIFWAIQGKILSLSDKDGNGSEIVSEFRHEGVTLSIVSPHLSSREQGDIKINENEVSLYLSPYGINALNENYTVESLSRKKMQIRSTTLRLYFTKF